MLKRYVRHRSNRTRAGKTSLCQKCNGVRLNRHQQHHSWPHRRSSAHTALPVKRQSHSWGRLWTTKIRRCFSELNLRGRGWSSTGQTCECLNRPSPANRTLTHLHVFVEVDGLIVDVVLHEVVIHTQQESHLRQRENIHELLHGVVVWTLWDENQPFLELIFQLRWNRHHYLAIEVTHNL